MKTKWVEFVGGPLHGQCRNIPYHATHWNAYPKVDYDQLPYDFQNTSVQLVTYKIERYWEGKPGFHREWFKGVLA